MRWCVCGLLLLAALLIAEEAEKSPTFTCGRTSVDPRHIIVRCAAQNLPESPEWRLYGASDDELMAYNDGYDFQFEAPDQWHLLEMRPAQGRRLRIWTRGYHGTVEWKKYGEEKR